MWPIRSQCPKDDHTETKMDAVDMNNFFQTLAGRRLTESTLPDLVQAVESCAIELKRLNSNHHALQSLRRLAEANCEATLRNGIATLEDGTQIDLSC